MTSRTPAADNRSYTFFTPRPYPPTGSSSPDTDENRHIFVDGTEPLLQIGFFLELYEVVHCGHGEFEHTVFVRVVGGEHFFVMGKPCIRIVASGAFVIGRKCSLVGKAGYMFPAFDAFYKGSEKKSKI